MRLGCSSERGCFKRHQTPAPTTQAARARGGLIQQESQGEGAEGRRVLQGSRVP